MLVKRHKKHVMKNKVIATFLFILLAIGLGSCRKEVIIDKNDSTNQGIEKNSEVAVLLSRVAMHDGSNDNIVDHANSFSIKMPYTVIVNGQTVVVQSEDDLDTIEDILDASDSDTDTIEIVFPITIILPDYTEVVINNQAELEVYINMSTGENEIDDDIECIDIVYPITISVYDTVTEQMMTVTINNDEDLELFMEDLDEDQIININFPIDLVLYDGTEITVSNLSELETNIENAKNLCDEDDDNDYNDDDCVNCTVDQIKAFLTSCNKWTVNALTRNNSELENNYLNFSLSFNADGALEFSNGIVTYNGSWSSEKLNNQIVINIDITGLPDLNGQWIVLEIHDDPTEKVIDLKIDDNNSLEFKSNCN